MHRRHHRYTTRRLLAVLFFSALTFCIWLSQITLSTRQVGYAQIATTRSNDAKQLVQQGVELYQLEDFQGAIEHWQTALSTYQSSKDAANTAIVLENLARAYQQIGQINQAINYWEQVVTNYRQLGNLEQAGRMLTEQAQTYNNLGQHNKAIGLLCGAFQEVSEAEPTCLEETALPIARAYNDQSGEVAALGSLGEAYRLRGDYQPAIQYLEKAKKIGHPVHQFWVLNSLGNSYASQAQLWNSRAESAQQRGASQKVIEFQQNVADDHQQALEHFHNSLLIAQEQNDKLGQMRVLLNLIRLDEQSTQVDEQRKTIVDDVNKYVQQALDLLQDLPDSRYKVYAAIDLANLKEQSSAVNFTATKSQCRKRKLEGQAEELLKEAVSIAKRIQHSRSESFALGELGHIYECRQDYEQALEKTQQAQLAADQELLAKDSLYLWEWQAGRIFNAQGKKPEAVAAYEQALAILDDIRGDLLIAERDLQFDFRDDINPLYRQFAQLRLERASLPSVLPEQLDNELNSALDTIDSLKLAELQNYFGNDCVLTLISEERVDELIGKETAVFSSIILEDRTAILLTLPNGTKRFKWIDVDGQTLREEIKQFRQGLEDFSTFIYDPTQAQHLYSWLIKPFASDLDPAQIKTLVFVQDGILRSIPMAALQDGKQFLVEKYAIATTPSLRLTVPATLNRQELRALILGVTKQTTVDEQTFGALYNVPSEISNVETQLPGSKKLVDDDFNRESLKTELDQTAYPVIHIATHGQFGTIPEDTFLVTGKNEKLTITELETAIRSASRGKSVELLALTACQTAVGDDRAALGLAGLAVQAGAKSALASLWFVPDASTKILVTEFYKNWLTPGTSKAEALSAAQRKLLQAEDMEEINDQYAHPAFWAPFILIGNWL
ncbi:CHAT domain-containing protein [Lyngbya aestuarii]|uniref:CHAT domain-containing protein n=1 Tax=Lyngbya aestuarii TaxID=118322 RepID=UPI00403DDC6B